MVETGRQAKTLKQIVNGLMNDHTLRVLAIGSGKGGVGKTNLVANLSYALCKKNKKVLIFDADLGLHNIDILLGLTPKFNVGHVLSGEKTVEEVIVEGPGGIHVLPATEGFQELTSLDQAQKTTLLDELDRVSFDYDFLIFDTGAGISSNVTYFCSAAHEILLIATAEPTSLTDVYSLMKVLYQKHNQKHFRLILNNVRSEREALEIFRHLSAVTDKFLSQISLEYLGFVVADPVVPKSVRQQKAFVELYPHSKVSLCINNLCVNILEETPQSFSENDRPFFWKNLFQVQ